MKSFLTSPAYSHHRTFLICTAAVLAFHVFYFDWTGWSIHFARYVLAPLFGLFSLMLLVYTGKVWHTRRCRCVLLCLLLFFLPLRQGYETMRFSIMHPVMENVAVELAQAHQFDTVRPYGFKPIDLPFPDRLLSRGGRVFLIPNDEGIAITYVKSNGLNMIRASHFTYQTAVPFLGKCPDDFTGFRIKHQWPLGGNWEYSEGYGFLEFNPNGQNM